MTSNKSALTSGTTIDYWGKFGLVQKRQLPSALHEFGGRFSDEASEGSCEMCLVEITQAANDIQDRNSLPEQDRCVSCSFDLAKRSVRDARGSQKVALCGTQG